MNSKYKKDIPEDADIVKITKNKNGIYHVEYTLPQAENLYCHNFGRIAPFIQAYGRYQMVRIILPNNEYIFRCHTDSFLANKQLELGNIFGSGLGQFKIDKQGNCKIKNVNNVIYKD